MYKKYILKKNGPKRPFQPSAVVRPKMKRLFGVAGNNSMIKTEIQTEITESIQLGDQLNRPNPAREGYHKDNEGAS